MNDNFNKAQKKDVLLVDPRMIRIEPGFNTRIDFGNMDELEASIIENGVKKPLQGYKEGDFYYVVDGARRLTATMSAIAKGHEIARIPLISERKKTIEERTLDILLSNDGKPLTALELGETYKKLLSYGLSVSEIARKTGKTPAHVSSMITVAESGTEVKNLINNGNISATLVAEVKSKVKDVDAAEKLIKTATAKKTGKVTKKDIIDILPVKESYTAAEVHLLLKQQIRACAEQVPMLSLKERVLQTKVLMELPVEEFA